MRRLTSVSSLLVESVKVATLIWMNGGTLRSQICCRRIESPLSLFLRLAAALGEVLWVVAAEVPVVARVPLLLSSVRPVLDIFVMAIESCVSALIC